MGRWTWLLAGAMIACSGGGKDDDDDEGGFDAASLCRDLEECTGDDADECEEASDQALDDAIDVGCGRDLLAYYDCFEDEWTCEDGQLSLVCQAEAAAYISCLQGSDTGGYVTTYTFTDYTTTTTPTVPYLFSAVVDCPDPSTISMYVQASVDSGSQAIIDMADTANASSWYEAHTLIPVSVGNGITDFETELTPASTYGAGFSSLYNCEPGVHIEEDNLGQVMTYIVRAYDGSGSLWDCFAAGNDPGGMVSGAYENWGNTINQGDINSGNCAVVRSAN